MLEFYRSVLGLIQALRLKQAATGLPPVFRPEVVALIDAVRDHATRLLADPALPPALAARLPRLIDGLTKAADKVRPAAPKAAGSGLANFNPPLGRVYRPTHAAAISKRVH